MCLLGLAMLATEAVFWFRLEQPRILLPLAVESACGPETEELVAVLGWIPVAASQAILEVYASPVPPLWAVQAAA